MKKILALATLALPLGASAATFTIDAEILKDAGGAGMQTTGLAILTAATNGTFFGPTPTSFTSGEEIVLQMWDLTAFNTAGVLSDISASLSFSGGWGTGDALKLYWYPTLDINATAPGLGTAYGSYRDPATMSASTLDSSDLWITAGESDTVSLKFFTTDATFLNTGEANAPAAGVASQTVVPEPSSVALLALAGAVVGARRRRRG